MTVLLRGRLWCLVLVPLVWGRRGGGECGSPGGTGWGHGGTTRKGGMGDGGEGRRCCCLFVCFLWWWCWCCRWVGFVFVLWTMTMMMVMMMTMMMRGGMPNRRQNRRRGHHLPTSRQSGIWWVGLGVEALQYSGGRQDQLSCQVGRRRGGGICRVRPLVVCRIAMRDHR